MQTVWVFQPDNLYCKNFFPFCKKNLFNSGKESSENKRRLAKKIEMAWSQHDVLLLAHLLLARMYFPLLTKHTARVRPLLHRATRDVCEVGHSLSRAQTCSCSREAFALCQGRSIKERKHPTGGKFQIIFALTRFCVAKTNSLARVLRSQ